MPAIKTPKTNPHIGWGKFAVAAILILVGLVIGFSGQVAWGLILAVAGLAIGIFGD